MEICLDTRVSGPSSPSSSLAQSATASTSPPTKSCSKTTSWPGGGSVRKWAGRWITFSFTIKTAIMVGQSLNAWLGDKARKALKWIAILLLGSEGIKGLRGLLLELLRRM